ncbi:MAG: CmcJ/NvfI family oxidoreductase [Pseudomonadota bacterium]
MPITAHVNYHVKKAEPQAFAFDVDGVEGTLVSPELDRAEVQVRDQREDGDTLRFDTDGIAFLTEATAVAAFDGTDTWQATYDAELVSLLTRVTGAEAVTVFDHTVRIDDPTALRRPARNVHNDYNRAGAEQRLIDLVGDGAPDYHTAGFAFVNVWRPVEHVIRSSPLGFIEPRSVDADDWMDIGLIYPDRHGQILGLARNPRHRWFYRSAMAPDEAVVFNIYDSRGRPQLAHSALDLPGDAEATVPRKSIESRTLLRFAAP